MANEIVLNASASSSSPSANGSTNESSRSSSVCGGDGSGLNQSPNPTQTVNNSMASASNPLELEPQEDVTADGDSSGESSYTNALEPSNENLNVSDGTDVPPVWSVEERSDLLGKEARQLGVTASTDGRHTTKVDDDGSSNPATPRIPSLRKLNDFYEVFKTTAAERRGNLCTVHQSVARKKKIDVACQTDPDEVTFPKITHYQRNNVTPPAFNKSVTASSSVDAASATSSTSADGTLRLMIQNFKNMADTVRGPSKKIQTVPWRIMVMPRQHVVQKKGTQKCLGFFLQCCPDAYSDSWSCQAAAELRLISQKQGVPHFTRKTNHVYTAKENDWGYSCFMTWADILDESQGYIKDDKVILEVSVKAEPPKNILTHEQFEKKIQDYMRLADIQSSRGLIDKAIEVNSSALKFCKDRDQDCKAELEAQKDKLIKMKLKQSIERIEKGPLLGRADDECSLNHNALKQAISGTANVNKQSNVGKMLKTGTTNTKAREVNNLEKTANPQSRAVTPPPEEKAADEIPLTELTPVEPQADMRMEKDNVLMNSAGKARSEGHKSVDENSDELADNLTYIKEAFAEDDGAKTENTEDDPLDLDGTKLFAGIEKDLLAKLAEDSNFEEQCKRIMCKHRGNGEDSSDSPNAIGSVLSCAAYKMTGNRQPWDLLCDTWQVKGQHVLESDEDSSSSGDVSSDSEAENIGHSVVGTPLSKKMKRSPENAALFPDDCDNCIQAMLEPPSLVTEEVSCQTDFSMLVELKVPKSGVPVNAHTDLSDSDRHYAQPKRQSARKTIPNKVGNMKFDGKEWRRKKLNELREAESLRKRQDEVNAASEETKERTEAAAELTKEGIARFTSQFSNPDSKAFPVFPLYHPPSQPNLSDEFTSDQLHSYMDDGSQHNIWSRQYIEEWLKYNIKYCWKYMKNSDNVPVGGEDAAMDFDAESNPHFTDAQVQQVMAALSVIGVNCVNAKRVVDKAAEFINTLEMRSKSPFLLSCLQRLALLAGDDKASDITKNDVDCSLEEHHLTAPLVDETDDLSALISDCPDDQHDYLLNREVHRISIFADQAVSKNPLMEVCHVERLNENTEKIAHRIAALENDKDLLSKQLISERERTKKAESKHLAALKQIQSQLQSEKEKYEKTMQQLNQKRNDLKKQERLLKQHEKDVERTRELQEKNESLLRDLQETRQKHTEEMRKLQRELQSSQDTRKNMGEEIKGRDAEIIDLKNQLSDKSLALKRSENALCSERKSFQSSVSALTERSKRAEIMFLEHKLDTGICILERAQKDAGQRVKDLEVELKKARNGAASEDLKNVIAEWKTKREEVINLIATSKAEFSAQVEQIRAGKPLAQLPKISVARPPPPPKSCKLSQYSAAIRTEKAAAAVAAAARSGILPSMGVIGNNRSSVATAGVIGSPISASCIAPGSPLPTLSKAPAPPCTISPIKSPITTSSIAPIGFRPNIQNVTAGDFSSAHSAAISSSANITQPSTSSASSGLTLGTGWSPKWDPPLTMNSINDLLNPSRSFGPIGADYGINSGSTSNQLSHPPPGLASASSHFASAQSNGWSSGVGSDWINPLSSGTSSNLASATNHFNQMHQGNSGYQSQQQQWSGWTAYSSHPSASPDVSSGMVENNRSSSPRRDILMDTLRNHFPHLPFESLKEYANDFLLRNNYTNIKNIPMSELINHVALISSKAQMWNKSSMPPMMHQPPPNVVPNSIGVNMPGVDPYQARLHSQQSNVHSHNMMQQQMRDGMDG